MQFYLVRHGQTQWNQQGILHGQLDSPLTPQGRAQALALHGQLPALEVDAIFCSDLRRCYQFAQLACPNQNLIQSALLRERHFGQLQGQILSQHPLWQQAYQQRFTQDQLAISGSESASAVSTRIDLWLNQVQRLGAERVLLFGHGEWLRILQNRLSGEFPWSNRYPLPDNGRLFSLRTD
ncbi:histidine phosphatase family protein [Ferrimonas senticii]|uniref:histidine phosphatase family protein n=1 Tax=Ferrimonas senticii TaxID=394566 RepID=UPI00041B0063|nr:histidine phosphatase family protein [Ferrimonas senticii]